MKVQNLIYSSIVEQSRQPDFYIKCGVPDTPDGRFEMITIHAFLVIRRLKNKTEKSTNLGQEIFNLMFADMEQNLREMGKGDLGVSKKLMAMTESFYGRIVAYESKLTNTFSLEEALNRNLFQKISPDEDQIKSIAKYIQREALRLEKIDTNELLSGNLSFGSPPDLSSEKND